MPTRREPVDANRDLSMEPVQEANLGQSGCQTRVAGLAAVSWGEVKFNSAVTAG